MRTLLILLTVGWSSGCISSHTADDDSPPRSDAIAADAAAADAAAMDAAVVDGGPEADVGPIDDARGLDDAATDSAPADQDPPSPDASPDAAPPDATSPDAAGHDAGMIDCPPCGPYAECVLGRCEPVWREIVQAGAWYGDGRVHVRLVFRLEPGDDAQLIAARAGGELLLAETGFPAAFRRGDLGHVYAGRSVPEMPDVVFIRANRRVVLEIPVEAQGEPLEGDACVVGSPATRCERGTRCLFPRACNPLDHPQCTGGVDGRCVPMQARIWARDGQHVLDVAAAPPAHFFDVTLSANLAVDDLGLSGWRTDWPAGPGRAVATIDGPIGDAPQLFEWGLRITDPLSVEIPAAVGEGEPCDPARVASLCDGDTACIDGVCQIPRPPEITDAALSLTPDGWGVWVRGRDPNGDLDSATLASDMGNLRADWSVDARVLSRLHRDGERFEAWAVGDFAPPMAEAWTITVRELNPSAGPGPAPRRVDAVTPEDRPRGAAGALCDPHGLILPCGPDLACSRVDVADAQYRCVAADPICGAPMPLAEPVRFDAPAEEAAVTGCLERPFGAEKVHFRAPRAGRYLFEARAETGLVMGLRRSCAHPDTEVFCARMTGEEGVTTRWIDLAEGEAIAVVVHSGGAPFTLSVRPLE